MSLSVSPEASKDAHRLENRPFLGLPHVGLRAARPGQGLQLGGEERTMKSYTMTRTNLDAEGLQNGLPGRGQQLLHAVQPPRRGQPRGGLRRQLALRVLLLLKEKSATNSAKEKYTRQATAKLQSSLPNLLVEVTPFVHSSSSFCRRLRNWKLHFCAPFVQRPFAQLSDYYTLYPFNIWKYVTHTTKTSTSATKVLLPYRN